MKIRALSILILIFLAFNGFANDSIKREFNTNKDIDKVSFFRDLSNEDKEEDILFFYTEFQKLLKKNNENHELKKHYLFVLGLINQIQNQHLEAISKFNELIKNSNYKLLARERMDIYVGMQESYLKLNLYSKVFDVNKKINSLIAKGIDYPLWSYNIQSRLYLQLEQYDKAISQLKSEIKLLYSNPKRDSLIIPSAFNDLGYYYYLNKDYNNALFYYNQSLKIAEVSLKNIDTLNFNNLVFNINNNVNNIKLKQNKFDEVISFYSDNRNTALEPHLFLAEAYLGKKDLYKSFKILNDLKSFDFTNSFILKLRYLDLLTQYYDNIGDFKNSYKYINQIKRINDSLASLDKKKLLQSNELNYFIEEKEKEVLKKDQIIRQNEKTILIVVIGSLIIILLIGAYIIKHNRKKRIEIERMNQSISKKNKTIKASLKEKEMLLQEIHHRVKNNLQVISGILSLQNSNITDEKSKELLKESQDRIQAIALLHKTMYQNDNFNVVDFQTYINELITYIKQTNKNLTKNITVIQKIEELNFSIDTAIPLSMLINELVTNCYKHAFTNLENGEIFISIQKNTSEGFLLSVKDNGIGLPKDYKKSLTNSIGFELIHGLSEQLDGKVNINIDNGTEIIIEFKNIK
jgi:two-component sensor histidine kinase